MLDDITGKVMVPENHNDQQPQQQQAPAIVPKSDVRRSTRIIRPHKQ